MHVHILILCSIFANAIYGFLILLCIAQIYCAHKLFVLLIRAISTLARECELSIAVCHL